MNLITVLALLACPLALAAPEKQPQFAHGKPAPGEDTQQFGADGAGRDDDGDGGRRPAQAVGGSGIGHARLRVLAGRTSA